MRKRRPRLCWCRHGGQRGHTRPYLPSRKRSIRQYEPSPDRARPCPPRGKDRREQSRSRKRQCGCLRCNPLSRPPWSHIYILYSCAITPMGNIRRSILPLRACSCALLQRFDDLARFGIDQRLIVNEGRWSKVRGIRLDRFRHARHGVPLLGGQHTLEREYRLGKCDA